MRVPQTTLLLVGLVIAAPLQARAQAVTGALAGRVLSADSEPLDGVVVIVGGPALQGERRMTSDNQGRFFFPTLPAGAYSVRLQQIGFTPLRVTEVTVVLGGTTSLGELRLARQTVELPEIAVSGAKPLVDPSTAANATVLDSSAFLALPSDRSYRALLPLVPETTPSPYGDGTNVAGATGVENAYFADGINITDPLVGDGSLNLPYNFVREVQVATGGYEAEFGRAQGGVVNIVTNAGGNEFHGQLLGFFTGNQLQAAPRWGLGQSQTTKFSQYDVGFSLGGPIRRDQLWFYVAYNPTVEASDATIPGIPTQRDTRTSHLFAAKLTGRLGPATDVTFTLLGDPSTEDYVGQLGAGMAAVSDPSSVLGRWERGGTAAALQVRSQVGDHVLLTASLARLSSRNDLVPRSGAVTDPAALASVEDFTTNTLSGGFFAGVQTSHVKRTSAQVGATLLFGSHALKLGAEYEDNEVLQDNRGGLIQKTADTAYSWYQWGFYGHTHSYVPAVYLQDSWAVTERWRLNAGLRWEGQFMEGDTGISHWIAPELAPRVGLVLEPGELGSQKVFLSYGRFFEEIPQQSVIVNLGLNTQVTSYYRQNPLVDTTGGVVTGGTFTGEPSDRNLKGQQYDEWTAGYERRLGREYRLGLRATYRTMLWVIEDGTRSVDSNTWISGNPGRGAMAYLPRATHDYRALEMTFERAGPGPFTVLVSYVLSRTSGNYTGVYSTDWSASGFLDNSGPQFDLPQELVNATGLLPNDRTHVVKLAGSYRTRFGLTVGTSAVVESGTPLSEYGTAVTGAGWWTFIRPRGTAGRTPATWDLDLRFAYDVPRAPGSRLQPRLLLDVFNVGNQHRPVAYQQLHYTTADQTGVNPNYMAVTQYQAPRRARLGCEVNF